MSHTTGMDRPIPERDEIPLGDQWDVALLFASEELWEKDFAKVEDLVTPLEGMRGKLNSAQDVGDVLRAEESLNRLLDKLYVYSHLRKDEDTRNNEHQGRESRIRARLAEIGGRLAWITPEILSHSEEELKEWMESPALSDFRYTMLKLLRRKPHVLSDKEETILSRAAEIFSAPSQTFTFLTNADMHFPEVEDHAGQRLEMSQGRYATFLQKNDRTLRRNAFASMYDTIGAFRNTIASTLSASVKLHNFIAQTRNFGSAVEAALHEDQVPVALYEALIEAAHEGLPAFYEYVTLRAQRLQLPDLDMFDMYVPLEPDFDMEVSFEQASQWAVEACEPLGDEYVRALSDGIRTRWVDKYENRGKRSGAYSSGCYDSHPYVLMNYQGRLDDVFTLAHELGHSMHSYLANRTQPYHYADYPIFIAEIASTLNEALLLRYLLEKTEDSRFRAYLYNHFCDEFKGTVFRQTMFAEFEKHIHEMDGTGEPLTPDKLSEYYYDLNATFFGDEVKADRKIGLEWARIPHFYYNFYVYKYATSFCASMVFIDRILGDPAKRDLYLDLLKAGGSDDPLNLVRKAGVDLASPQTLRGAFSGFAAAVKNLNSLSI